MTRDTITEDLVHALVTDSHSEGVVDLYVSAAVEHRGQALLVASGGDELDTSYELPSTAVLPGEHLLDALCRCLLASVSPSRSSPGTSAIVTEATEPGLSASP
jgi:hypothetical protein